MRAALLLLALLLAACGKPSGSKDAPAARGQQETLIPAPAAVVEPVDARVECAVDGAAYARICTVEKVETARGLGLTLRSPSGSFRRLLVTKDGRGVVTADGAEPAKVKVLGPDRIEVAVGGDRYRLPAAVKP